ncbi:MAG TPA: hypothetical protein VMT30_04400 [Candidatus Saccharimonadia bacterium]|nr:hypothetical protein [Candidatus Saccharimonadia bacterium]
MIKAPEFYQIFKQHDEPLKQAGFARQGRHKYSRNGNTLQIILGKWSWTEDEGWDFFIRITDLAYPAEGHPHQPSTDVTPATLVSQKLIDPRAIDAAYKAYAAEHKNLYGNIPNRAFVFYDAEHLGKILDLFLSAIVQAAHNWDTFRNEERKKPRAPFRKHTAEELQAIEDRIERDLRSAGLQMELVTPPKKTKSANPPG